MLERGLVLELRREHLLRDGFAAMLRHPGAIVVVIIVIVFSFTIEIARTFVFVGSSILYKGQHATHGLGWDPETYELVSR